MFVRTWQMLSLHGQTVAEHPPEMVVASLSKYVLFSLVTSPHPSVSGWKRRKKKSVVHLGHPFSFLSLPLTRAADSEPVCTRSGVGPSLGTALGLGVAGAVLVAVPNARVIREPYQTNQAILYCTLPTPIHYTTLYPIVPHVLHFVSCSCN